MKNKIVVYDDSLQISHRIKTILGNKTFGNMIIKRQTLKDRIKKLCNNENISFYNIFNKEELSSVDIYKDNDIFLYLQSSSAIFNEEDFKLILKKMDFIEENCVIKEENKILAVILPNKNEYKNFIKDLIEYDNLNFFNGHVINTRALVDIDDYDKLLMYISSGFDSRYFNSLSGNNYEVIKKSKDKKKMKMEYSYYWLLPENMKSWMVMPYDYKEENDYASYTMERMPMTDIAIRWTNEAIDEKEFKKILDKIFYFFKIRKSKIISKEEYKNISEKLYFQKVEDRIKELKSLEEYSIIENYISNGTDFSNIDDIFCLYKKIFTKVEKKHLLKKKWESVIGHGDVFFANMLYSKELNLLRLIDPKGALSEKDLWTNPYYDIAKLSHSICGNYDFFNINGYDIIIDKNLKMELDIHFDNTKYVNIFKEYLSNNGYDYNLIRLYESSLFLSMLPLHIDNPHKVMGFILNAIKILKELEKNV